MSTPFTAVRDTPNKSPRQNVPRRGVVLHHAAMTSLSGLRSLAMGVKEVSASAIVKDDEAEKLVGENDRAWSLGDAWADSSFRSVETCNESTNGWTISDASHWTLARLVAYWAKTDGFYPHRSGNPTTWTVIGHREVYTIYGRSYSTACPGGMDLDLVTRRAQALLAGATTAAEVIAPPIFEEDDMQVYRIKEKGGLNGTSVAIWPNGFTVFESDYWRDLFVEQRKDVGLKVREINRDALNDELRRLGIPVKTLELHVWNSNPARAVPGFGSWSKLDDILAKLNA